MIQEHRIALHQIPELGMEERQTKAYIMKQIKDLNCTMHEIGATGLLLYFDARANHTIAFRADMDALPIEEKSGVPFASKHFGKMHACGHDGHMAVLLGLAEYANEADLSNNVVLIFQPSEEVGGGIGARSIIESGLLERYGVEAIFGLHLWPGLTQGTISSRPNELLAMSSEVNITINGRSAHVADSELAIDALQIASHFLTDVYTAEAAMDPEILRLLKFGYIQSGKIRNVISNSTRIEGTLRSYDLAVHAQLKAMLTSLALNYEKKTGCTIIIEYDDGVLPVINDQALFNRLLDVLPNLNVLEKPVLQAEDFGVFTERYPSVFFLLGIGDSRPLHAENFDFNMEVLDDGVTLFKTIIERY